MLEQNVYVLIIDTERFINVVTYIYINLFSDPNFTAEYLYTSMVSDIRQTCPVNILAHRLAYQRRSPVYRYTLTERPSSPVNKYKALL